MDAAAGVAAREGGEEEGSALRGFIDGRGAEVDSVLEGGFLCGEGEDVDVCVFHEFLLDARRGEIDEVTGYVSIELKLVDDKANDEGRYSLIANRTAAARACHPA